MINLAKYNEIMDKIENLVNYYDRIEFSNNKYTLYLANGDLLNIRLFENNLPHILGVNIEYLRLSNKFNPGMNSYEILKYFIENRYTFGNLGNSGKLSFDLMFSKHIDEKLEAFNDNINIRNDDIYTIVKYDSEKTYKLEDKAEICDYYIVRQKLNKYFVLGVVKNEKYYIPSTSRKYDDFQELEKYISRIACKQELTYPHLIKIENYKNSYKNTFSLALETKEALLDKTIKISQKYGATASVAKDYNYTLNKIKNDRTEHYVSINVLRLLSDSIKSGNVLDESIIEETVGDIELNSDIINLINVCNNSLCYIENNESAINSYSTLNDENKKLKEELEQLKEALKIEEDERKKVDDMNIELALENEKNKEKISIFEEAYQKIKEI